MASSDDLSPLNNDTYIPSSERHISNHGKHIYLQKGSLIGPTNNLAKQKSESCTPNGSLEFSGV